MMVAHLRASRFTESVTSFGGPAGFTAAAFAAESAAGAAVGAAVCKPDPDICPREFMNGGIRVGPVREKP